MDLTQHAVKSPPRQDDQAVALIDALGGSVAVSKACGLTHPAVSQWKRNGIPRAWLLYFRERHPENFDADGRVIAFGALLQPHEVGKAASLAPA